MAKKKLPIELRVASNVEKKIGQGLSLNDISTYVLSTMLQFKLKHESILDNVREINPLIAESAKASYINALEAKSNKTERERIERENLVSKNNKLESERIEGLKEQYISKKENGSEIRWAVALKPEDRKLFFSAKEIKEIVALRREKLSTNKVRQVLDCTLSEINRWDEEGLLPHAFTQVIQVGGKANTARYWLKSEVVAKKDEINTWRESHELKKSFKRKKSPLTLAK